MGIIKPKGKGAHLIVVITINSGAYIEQKVFCLCHSAGFGNLRLPELLC